MKKILVTGANGIIGAILKNKLTNFLITPIDLPEYDVRDYKSLLKIFPGHDTVIHLAWNTKSDSAGNEFIDPDNSLMFLNVYRAALESGVPRVIMASSVHAHRLMIDRPKMPLSPYSPPEPNNPYGAHKLFMEILGSYYASRGLEIVCVRFGGVTANNKPIEHEELLFLSHEDLGSLITACIEKNFSEKFYIIWGMSRNAASFYDLSNPFSWIPQNGA